MPVWDSVLPTPQSYGPPLVGAQIGDMLASLPQAYQQAQQGALATQLQRGTLAQQLFQLQAMRDYYNQGQGGGPQGAAVGAASGVTPDTVSGAAPASDDLKQQFFNATIGQEASGRTRNVPDSQTGNIGPGQISQALFNQYAQPGENIRNDEDNLRVARRITDSYLDKYNGDWRRAAVAYYNGEGNVAPPDSQTPWKGDIGPRKGVAGPTSSGYVRDIGMRMARGRNQQVASADPNFVPQQGPATAQAAGGPAPTPQAQQPAIQTAQADTLADPQDNPRVKVLDKKIEELQKQARQQGRAQVVPALAGAAKTDVEETEKNIDRLQQQRQQLVEQLGGERKMKLETQELQTRGEQAAKLGTTTKEEQDQLEYLRGVDREGIEATSHIGQLDTLAELAKKAPYGALTGIRSFLGQYGIPTEGLTDIQAYEDAINFMAPQLRPPGSGPLKSNEIEGFRRSLGGLLTTPEGRIVAVNNLKLMSQYKQGLGAIARNTDLTPSQRTQKMAELPFPKLQTSLPEQPQKQVTQEEYAKLPRGARYLAPDGQYRVKQ